MHLLIILCMVPTTHCPGNVLCKCDLINLCYLIVLCNTAEKFLILDMLESEVSGQ